MWDNFHCEKCGLTNWLNLGDMEDQTVPDIEGFQCYGCRSVNYIIDQNELRDQYADRLSEGEMLEDCAFIENGRTPPGGTSNLPTVRELFDLKATQTGRLKCSKEVTLTIRISQKFNLPNPEINPAAYDNAQREIIEGLERQGWKTELLGEEV